VYNAHTSAKGVSLFIITVVSLWMFLDVVVVDAALKVAECCRTSCRSCGHCWTSCCRVYSSHVPTLNSGSMLHLQWLVRRYVLVCTGVKTLLLSVALLKMLMFLP